MGRVMISKKFKAFLIVCLTALIGAASSALAQGNQSSASQLPILHYAGVIPVQWDKSEAWGDLSHLKKSLGGEFSDAVRQSKRFVVLNDDLVATLWKSAAGRKELEKDYELSVYASLDVSARGDMVILTARLLSPSLQTRLQESDVLSRRSLSELTREQSSARLYDLVMRMINRLPVDAHIMSVNGSYVTLSGGSDQGVRIGSQFDVHTATVESLHPANGSWLSFASIKTGRIEIIEVKKQSSIGKISSLVHDNSIKPGHGVVIEAISGRSRFARAEEKSAMASAKDSDSGVIAQEAPKDTAPAVVKSPEKPSAAEASPEKNKAPSKPDEQLAAPQEKENAEQAPVPADTQKTAEKPASDEAPETDNFTARLIPKGSELRTWIGMKMWSISGSSSAAAQLPPWIVNSAGGSVHRKFSDTIDWSYGLDIGFGPTGKGSFFAYDLHASGRWHLYQKDILPGADDIFFGLNTSLISTQVSKETSGGYDMTMVTLNIGVHGWAKPEFIGDKIEWTGEIFYPLYVSGRFGVRGFRRNIETGSSTSFKLGSYVGERPEVGWQYGAAIEYESSAWDLTKSKTAKVGSMGLMALARRNI